MAIISVAYVLSPIDLIPDFIPVLGYLDDVVLLPAMVALTIKLIPDEVLEKNKKEVENIWSDGKPKRWYHRGQKFKSSHFSQKNQRKWDG